MALGPVLIFGDISMAVGSGWSQDQNLVCEGKLGLGALSSQILGGRAKFGLGDPKNQVLDWGDIGRFGFEHPCPGIGEKNWDWGV